MIETPHFEKGLNITINTTEDCNLRCKYCYEIKKKKKSIDFETCKKFIDILVTDENLLGIEEDEYKRVTAELDDELTTITSRRLNLDSTISTFYDNLARMIKIADSCYFLIKSSRFSQKRQIIKLLTSNCLVDGKNVVITIKKPFAQMLETKGCLSWLGQLDSNQ